MYEYEIQGHYGSVWETVTTEDTAALAREQIEVYRENERGTSFRIKKVKATS